MDGDGEGEHGTLPSTQALAVAPPSPCTGAAVEPPSGSSLSLTTAWMRSFSSTSMPQRFGAGGEPLGGLGRPYPRVFEVWPQVGGRNRFHCFGLCVTGPKIDRWHNLCAWSFIILPTAIYFLLCAAPLWRRSDLGKALPVITALAFTSTVVFLLLTSCTDPGILPRYELQVAVAGLEAEVAEVTGISPVSIDAATSQMIYEITQAQENAGYKWCNTCKVVRPPRCSHCQDCDNCVLTYDHHCPFVNNCVGQRNYMFFSAFLLSTGCLGFAVAVGAGLCVSANYSGSSPLSIPTWMLDLLVVVIAVPTAVMLVGVLGLICFHLWLACLGRTTKEVCTGRRFSEGRSLLLRGPSLIHARARVSYPMLAV